MTLTPKQEEIAVRAYHLYLEGGCRNGRDLDHWLKAEREIGGKFFAPPTRETPVAPEKKAPTAKKAAPAKKVATVKKAAVAPVAKKAAKKKA